MKTILLDNNTLRGASYRGKSTKKDVIPYSLVPVLPKSRFVAFGKPVYFRSFGSFISKIQKVMVTLPTTQDCGETAIS